MNVLRRLGNHAWNAAALIIWVNALSFMAAWLVRHVASNTWILAAWIAFAALLVVLIGDLIDKGTQASYAYAGGMPLPEQRKLEELYRGPEHMVLWPWRPNVELPDAQPRRAYVTIRIPRRFVPFNNIPPLKYLAFALAILTVVFSFLALLPALIAPIRAYNFVLSATAVVTAMAWLTLRAESLKQETWKTLNENYLKIPSFSAVAAMGFGSVGLTEWLQGPMVQSGIRFSQVGARTLGLVFLFMFTCVVLASFIARFGRGPAKEESHVPVHMFVAAFAFAWIANVGFWTLLLDGILLTAAAHI
jgi:hypothetical protein